MTWEPIETAPKDGTLVWLRTRYSRHEPWVEKLGWWESGPCDLCWYADNGTGDDEMVEPLEWRPAPEFADV